MESLLADNLTEYIRHFLMRTSNPIKQNEVYHELKRRAEKKDQDPIEYLKELNEYSSYYSRLIDPKEKEDDPDFKKYFIRLRRINVTTVYPLILTLYNEYKQGMLTKSDFVEILKTIENFLIRRFVCNIPTNSLSKEFSSVCLSLINNKPDNLVKAIKEALQSKSYPTDINFFNEFQQKRFYGAGDITKLILEILEDHITPKDVSKEIAQEVKFDGLEIEHIMPQNPDRWKDYLGYNWEQIHNVYLNTIGNLTLTGYNPELRNLEFENKKEKYLQKNDKGEIIGLNLNKYVVSFTSWREDDIKKRAKKLAEQALEIWSYFGQENPSSYDLSNDSELAV